MSLPNLSPNPRPLSARTGMLYHPVCSGKAVPVREVRRRAVWCMLRDQWVEESTVVRWDGKEWGCGQYASTVPTSAVYADREFAEKVAQRIQRSFLD